MSRTPEPLSCLHLAPGGQSLGRKVVWSLAYHGHLKSPGLLQNAASRNGASFITLRTSKMQELLVLYRHAPEPEWLAPLRRRILGAREEEKSPRYRRRNQIFLRVFRDVPLPTWKIVFPDKLLQFRPLDGLRADLLSVAGKSLRTHHLTCHLHKSGGAQVHVFPCAWLLLLCLKGQLKLYGSVAEFTKSL